MQLGRFVQFLEINKTFKHINLKGNDISELSARRIGVSYVVHGAAAVFPFLFAPVSFSLVCVHQ